ncbi:MAG: hypothetical protein AB3N14_18695 [Flavobacteriaceae bacterium]
MGTKEKSLRYLMLVFLGMALLTSSCDKDDDEEEYEDIRDIPDGVADHMLEGGKTVLCI